MVTGDATHPIVEVHTAAELGAVSAIYARLVATLAPATLEVRLAPGTYTNTSLQLQDGARRGQVSVIVRCDGVAVLDRVPFAIDGDTVTLSGLVWRPGPRGVAAAITVRTSLDVSRVAVIGATGSAQIAGPVFSITAGYRTGAKEVSIRDAWFVGNRTSGALIGLMASAPDRFGAVTVTNVAFVDNAAGALIDPAHATAVATPMARADAEARALRLEAPVPASPAP